MAIKYKWLAARLKEQLPSYKNNGLHRLPTEAWLCKHYHMSRQTVRDALRLLEQEGLIERRQGSGSYLTGLSAQKEYNVIDILLPNTEEYLFPALAAELRKVFGEKGFSCRFHEVNGSLKKEREILEEILSDLPYRGKGLLVMGTKSGFYNPNLPLYEKILEEDIPLVFFLEAYPELPRVPTVKPDYYHSTGKLVAYSVDKGNTDIGIILPFMEHSSKEMYQGYLTGLVQARLPFEEDRVFWVGDQLPSYEQLCHCEAVICHDDLMAYLLEKKFRPITNQGKVIPAILSLGGTYLSASSRHPFYSLEVSTAALASEAYSLLYSLGLCP